MSSRSWVNFCTSTTLLKLFLKKVHMLCVVQYDMLSECVYQRFLAIRGALVFLINIKYILALKFVRVCILLSYMCHLVLNGRQEQADLLSMDALNFCSERYLLCGSDSPGGKPAIVQIWDIDALSNLSTFPAHDTVSVFLSFEFLCFFLLLCLFSCMSDYFMMNLLATLTCA